MQKTMQSSPVRGKVAVFPAKAASRQFMPDARTQFERLLIFVLCALWATGVVAWTLLSVAGFGHTPSTLGLGSNSFSLPDVLPSVQTATIFVVRLVCGW